MGEAGPTPSTRDKAEREAPASAGPAEAPAPLLTEPNLQPAGGALTGPVAPSQGRPRKGQPKGHSRRQWASHIALVTPRLGDFQVQITKVIKLPSGVLGYMFLEHSNVRGQGGEERPLGSPGSEPCCKECSGPWSHPS